jgi:hypothetical protein
MFREDNLGRVNAGTGGGYAAGELQVVAPGPTDRELVLAFRPGARAESRVNPRTGTAEFRVVYQPVPGQRPQSLAWQTTEVKAWRGACVRLGLRVRRPG